MKSKLAILLWATSPDEPSLCATPFFHAAAAGAMDVEVEIYFSARSVLLLVPGMAQNLYAGNRRDMSVYDHMKQALTHGARFIACHDALDAHGIAVKGLMPEVGFAGAASFIGRVLDPEWASLTY